MPHHNNRYSFNAELLHDLSSDETVAFFEDILNRGLILRVKVTGRSMLPFLAGGEILTIQKVPSFSLQIGDLIFSRPAKDFLCSIELSGNDVKKIFSFFRQKGMPL